MVLNKNNNDTDEIEDIFDEIEDDTEQAVDNTISQPAPDLSGNKEIVQEKPESVKSIRKVPVTQAKSVEQIPSDQQADGQMPKSSSSKKNLITRIILFAGAVVLLGAVGFTVWQSFSNRNDDDTNENSSIINENTNYQNNTNITDLNSNLLTTNNNQGIVNLNTVIENQNLNISNVNLDSDFDGLLDSEEIEIGTDPNKIDTDEDGLYDYDEVKIYFTDPLDPDTDDDGYSDGEEVKGGYNPNGSGELLNLNTSLSNING